MDTRQWIEPEGASVDFLQPWVQVLPDDPNVVFLWPELLPHSQPAAQHTLAFIPDTIGVQWNLDVQTLPDQSVGVVTTFPHISYMNNDPHCDTIASITPTFDIRRSLNCLVPQRRYASNRRSTSIRNFTAEPSICFNTHSGPGFSMRDALNKNFKALVGREDPMLPYGTAISLRFEFEGYKSWTSQVKTRDSRKVPHPIPRAKLAHEVAKKLVAFLKKRQATLDRSTQGAGALESIDVKDIFLVRLDHVSKASWQPQFMIV